MKVPANLEIKAEDINKEMFKRQGGYGRGRRMQIEKDAVEIVSGVRNGYTLVVQLRLLSQMMISHIGEILWELSLFLMKKEII